MKAIWRGSISFALLNIPVKLYSATHSKAISFHMLHKKCSTPLNYERHCPTCNQTVPWQDVAHGYEYEKNKFVTITEEDTEKLPVKSTKNIEIIKFIPADEIKPIYYGRAYYLEPEEGGERAYALLREVMKDGSLVALSKITLKDKEHIAAIGIHGDIFVLHTLFYADEIVKTDALNIPTKIHLEQKELSLASELIRRYRGGFDIEHYHDEFRDALMELIKSKIAGKEVKVAPVKEARKVVSLMDALKKSLKESSAPKGKKEAVVVPISRKSATKRG